MSSYDDLKQKYPLLYASEPLFECEEGWYDLINELSTKLEEEIKKEKFSDVFFATLQIKEKYGCLRFYMSNTTDKMNELIAEAENKSSNICEICGEKGKLQNKFNQYEVRCEKHS